MEAYILGVSHIYLRCLKGDVFWDGSVHFGSVAYISKMLKGGCILGWKRTFWRGRIEIFKRGYILRGRVDSGRASYRHLKGCIFLDGRVDSSGLFNNVV